MPRQQHALVSEMGCFHCLFSEASDKYAEFRPTYPVELYQRILDYGCPNRELAIDVATGTGQAAAELAKSFTRVIGADAETIPNVAFKVAVAESFVEDAGIAEGSADLITVASALHWLDIHAFYNECRKALKPGGIFAAWAYNLFKFPNNPRANDAMKALSVDVLQSYWAPPTKHVDTRYTLLVPSQEIFEESELFSFETKLRLDMHSCVGFLSTLSAYKAFRSANPTKPDPLEVFRTATMEALGLTDAAQTFEVILPIFGILAKNPIPVN